MCKVVMSAQVRDMAFNMRNDLDPYGIQLGFAIDAVSALRGTVSAAASDADNYSDQGITIYGVSSSPCPCVSAFGQGQPAEGHPHAGILQGGICLCSQLH